MKPAFKTRRASDSCRRSPVRPNVLLLITHDTGRHVSPYGVDTVDTPACERLAREGVTFEQCFCVAPQCSPARAAIVTGRYPHANGVMGLTHGDFGWKMNATERPIARRLGAAGYATWLLAGQHETHDPHTLGFDEVDVGYSLLEAPARLDHLLAHRDPSQPFYCQIGGPETHLPWQQLGTEPDTRLGLTIPPYLQDTPGTRADMARFQGMIRRFDTGLGGLLDGLDRRGLAEDTLLIVTTDHGPALPMAKGTLRDPGIGVMLFLRHPAGGWRAGRRQAASISHVDLLPTILETIGLRTPATLHGRSFRPLLSGGRYPARQAVFAEKTFHNNYDPMRAIRTPRHKLIVYFERSALHSIPGDVQGLAATRDLPIAALRRSAPEELFDLVEDPLERCNLAGDPSCAATVKRLRRELAAWMVETRDPLRTGPIESPLARRRRLEMFG